jgi:hypothetical protein
MRFHSFTKIVIKLCDDSVKDEISCLVAVKHLLIFTEEISYADGLETTESLT